jgi:hypothetical protein
MPCTEIDDLESIRFLSICNYGKSVITPHCILGCLISIFNLRLKVRPVTAVELATERAVCDLTRDPWIDIARQLADPGEEHCP